MGSADGIDFPSANLSGQKLRVAAARTLMYRPERLLADEPTGNLGRASAAQGMDLIGDITRADGSAFLILPQRATGLRPAAAVRSCSGTASHRLDPAQTRTTDPACSVAAPSKGSSAASASALVICTS